MTSPDPGSTSQLRSSRRVDWRVLLEDPNPRRAAIHGDDPALAASLGTLGTRVVPVRSADLVVARNPSPADIAQVARDATPRAAIVAELDGRMRSPRALSRVEGALRSSGRRLISLVAWPAIDECRELIPISSAAREWWISHHLGRRQPLTRAMARVADIPTRMVLPLIVVALPADARSAVLALGAPSGLDVQLPWILLTPRYRASRHVVLLGNLSHGSAQIVVKAARLRGDSSTTNEAAVLAALGRQPAMDGESVPRLLRASEAAASLTGFAMSGLDGVPIAPGDLKRDPRIADLIRIWLRSLELDREMTDAIDPMSIANACARLETAAGVHDGLAGRVLAALSPLVEVALPRTIEHGDMGPPNLLRRRDGGLGVIDWETGRLDGLPLVDLIFALGVIAAARTDARQPHDQADAAGAAFADGGWARTIIDGEARRLGIAAGTVWPLIVACWARQLGTMAARQGVIGGPEAADDAAHLLQHRYRLILERTLAGEDARRSRIS